MVLDGHYVYTCLPSTEQTAFATYLYFINKLFDLVETLLFVLRKRFAQITVLHVYHHVAVCVGVYVSLLIEPGGHSGLMGFLNLIVHAVMYTYYFLAAYAPSQRSRLDRYKIHLTQMQIVSCELREDAFFFVCPPR